MHIDIEALIQLAEQAGQAILQVYRQDDFDLAIKQDKSPLTAADMASHRVILEGLQRLTPQLPVLSEEAADIPFATRAEWRSYWLIDPLDGTKEFIKRNGEFTVNIALITDHRPRLGIVHVPVSGVSYCATADGAFLRTPNGADQPLRVTRPATQPLRVVGSRSHAGDSLLQFLQRLGEHQLVSMGSSLKLCLVAAGKADIYPRLGPTSEWDTAAAQAVVEAAGGQVTDVAGNPLRYNTKESLLNPFFLVFADDSRDWTALLPPQPQA
jgi:3'(2'), 5'-bisphosphate nucleotidase